MNFYNNELLTDNEDISDNESNYTDTESNVNIYDFMYDPEEPSLTKFNLVMCIRYNQIIHGVGTNNICNHYLTLIRFTQLAESINIFDYYRNYDDVDISLENSQLEIAECFTLPSHHCVSIIKTIWIRLIQRTWKKIYKLKKQTYLYRRSHNALKYREIYGRWPDNCLIVYGLKGMLSYLSH